MKPIAPSQIRYIKLGRGGAWEKISLEHGELHFGYRSIPHDLCMAGDWDGIAALIQAAKPGRKLTTAQRMMREVRDFYEFGADCLWITFYDGCLWWAFAEPEVTWLGTAEEGKGARVRKVIGGWRNTDIHGVPLREAELSTALTQVKAHRATTCRVRDEAYLLRRLNGEDEPLIAEALSSQKALIDVADQMIRALHWRDFEILVDLIFARSGWQRISDVGRSQKDIDLAFEQVATGERACVQVKSGASRATLIDYVGRCLGKNDRYDRLFFVCHSPKGELVAPPEAEVHVWTGPALADKAVKAGLFDWLIERAR